jgi:hypothetical protein
VGAVDFRVGGRIFATLAAVAKGFGNVMLAPEQQRDFVAEWPDLFLPVPGKWGEGGVTHIRLAAVTEDIARGALQAAWKRRVAANQTARRAPSDRRRTVRPRRTR